MDVWPETGSYGDWKTWGNQIVFRLKKALDPTAFRARRVLLTDLQAPTEDGIVLIVDDATGGPTLAFSKDGAFIDVRTGVAVV